MASLDDLPPAALDALGFGVVQLDSGGIVRLINRTGAALFGLEPGAAPGRHLFREVAPAANVPAFHGRFLEGVRAGRLDERFTFTLGTESGPVRAQVQMRPALGPGRYWITLTDLQPLAPGRHQEARRAVHQRSQAEPVDSALCEREPIHVPGAVHPGAVLLATDASAEDDLRIAACSANAADALGLPPEQLLGRPLSDVLPAVLLDRLAAARRGDGLDPAHPLRAVVALGAPPRRHLAVMHAHGGRILIELELLPARAEDFGAADPIAVQAGLARLRAAASLPALARAAAGEVRAITGFERVLVYRFDPDWNGEAIAESRVAAWDHSLLGLRFPASDIPAQARALYARAPSRFVIDRDAVPAPLLAAPGARNEPLDLTFTAARSLSPVHLEYQRNLGVNGSMSASILVEGRLWGLVIGHHRKPHYLPPETRAAATTLTDGLALRLHEIETQALWREQQEHLDVQVRLLEQMAGADDVQAALGGGEGAVGLTDLFGATGAAIADGGAVTLFGLTPDEAEVAELVSWLRGQDEGARSVHTDRLSQHFPPAAAYRATASGLLAAFVDGRRYALLWFRPEVAGTVTWGGDPRKSVVADPASRILLPRRSFERWVEERSGFAEPWADWQVSIAERLAGGIRGVLLRQSRRVAELSAKQDQLVAALADKERLLAQKDVLTREIDHRVKNSLQIVAAFLQMQGRTVADPAARQAFDDTYARVMSVARVHNSLYQSESIEEVDLGQTIQALCDDLAAMAGANRDLAFSAEPGLMVPYRTAVGLSLIATELVTNALKYAYAPGESGRVDVRLRQHEKGGGVCLTVSDRGRGLPEEWGRQPRRGLGMRLIQAMLDQIGGRMIVASESGARFTVCT